RYRGYYYDTEIELYYLKSRYYDSETGRFVNADDFSYLNPVSVGGLNLYAYCGNDPINFVDPDGTFLKQFGRFINNSIIQPLAGVLISVCNLVDNAITGLANDVRNMRSEAIKQSTIGPFNSATINLHTGIYVIAHIRSINLVADWLWDKSGTLANDELFMDRLWLVAETLMESGIFAPLSLPVFAFYGLFLVRRLFGCFDDKFKRRFG
ncbi:MAG: RHS repeat-associated core domain-containing protein, partial [Firmicutes bacterium]|nr:RHS repeat-associated core domain-containing protein [Bacillota bacterium]